MSENLSSEDQFREVVEEMNQSMKDGEFECPACGCETGLMLTVSCAKCGYIPEEARA